MIFTAIPTALFYSAKQPLDNSIGLGIQAPNISTHLRRGLVSLFGSGRTPVSFVQLL